MIMSLSLVGVGAALWPPAHSRTRSVDARWVVPGGSPGWLARMGGLVRRWSPLGAWLGDEVTDSVVGAGLIVALTMGALAPPLGLVVPSGIAFTVVRRRRERLQAAAKEVLRGLPDVIDLLSVGVGAGLTLRHALAHAVPWMPPPFSAVFEEALQRSNDGEPLVRSLGRCERRLGDPTRPLLRVLMAAERDGAALIPALERAGDEARRQRRVKAEERARKVPVTMLFPLVVCVLPAFALLTIVPLMLGTLADLELPG